MKMREARRQVGGTTLRMEEEPRTDEDPRIETQRRIYSNESDAGVLGEFLFIKKVEIEVDERDAKPGRDPGDLGERF